MKLTPRASRDLLTLNRRAVLLGGGAACLARPTTAQDRIFLTYTQADLDHAYDEAIWAPNASAMVAAYGSDSAAIRVAYPPHTKPYGPGDAENLDVFTPKFPGRAPIFVLFHGGDWHRLSKDDVSTPAPTLVDSGGVFVAPNFGNADAVGLAQMVEQCRNAIRWVAANAAKFGGNADKIVIAGHSSGAHIAALLLTTDWTQYGLPMDLIKGGLLMSGIYDLYPVMLSAHRNYLKLTPDDVAALSPIRHLDRLRCPVTVAWGDEDSPEYKRQSTVMAEALQGMGELRSRHTLFNTNHFQILRQLDRPDTVLGRVMLAMMDLA